MAQKIYIEKGMRYGHLVSTGVHISRVEMEERKRNGEIISGPNEFKCDCGNICYRRTQYFKNKRNIITCGLKCQFLSEYNKSLIPPVPQLKDEKLNHLKKGNRFGSLVIVDEPKNIKSSLIKCICDCGKTSNKNVHELINGSIKCCSIKCKYSPRVTHDLSMEEGKRSRIYGIFMNMKYRCDDPLGRCALKGITYSEEFSTIQSFIDHVGYPPSIDHRLERNDKEGNFEPDNVEWILRKRRKQKRKIR